MPEVRRENFFVELLKFFILALVIVIPIRLWVAEPFIVSGASMEPTFDTGQYLIIDELSYHFGEPERGSVIIFRYPRNPSEFFIKRVIGLPGETVHITNDAVAITTKEGITETLDEPYLHNQGNGTTLSMTLDEGEYFVMGDNRPDSSDSRSWGPVPRANIVGRAFLRLIPPSMASYLPGNFSFAENSTLTPSPENPRAGPTR